VVTAIYVLSIRLTPKEYAKAETHLENLIQSGATEACWSSH
jgi:hypothetical protein